MDQTLCNCWKKVGDEVKHFIFCWKVFINVWHVSPAEDGAQRSEQPGSAAPAGQQRVQNLRHPRLPRRGRTDGIADRTNT